MEWFQPVAAFLRAVLAVVMLVGFYLLGFGLCAGLAWLCGWMWLAFPDPVAGGFGGLVAVTAVGLAVPGWKVLRTRLEPPAGTAVAEWQAPELWSQVRELAESVGTRPPDEIRLWSTANAGVWEDARWFGLRAGRRLLYLGVPLLQVLTVAQVRAVLAHELGHYSRHHTRLGVATYRGGRAIIGTIAEIGPHRVVGMVLVGYATLYFRVSLLVMRRMELAADRTAARVAGQEAFVQALRGIDRISGAWAYFVASYVAWARIRAYQPAELLDWFGWVMMNRPDELVRSRTQPADLWSRWDTHPPIDDRVALVAAQEGPAVVPDPRPATVLVPDPHDLAATLRTPDFDRWVEQVAQAEAERDAEWLYRVAAQVLRHRQGHRCRIGCVLDLLAAGRGDQLQRELRVPDLAGVVEVVLVAVAATLVAAEGAQWRHQVGEPITLVRLSTLPVELRPQVTRACHEPAAVAVLQTRLIELGVGSAVVTAAPGAWRPPLQLGHVYRAEPAPVTVLLLPEELFLLAYSPSGTRRLPTDVFDAGLAAAVLAELRLRGRVRLAPTEDGTVVVDDATPTGYQVLDAVLDQVGSRELPAYLWLQRLGPDVSNRLAAGLLARTSGLDHQRVRAATQRARAGIAHALKTGDLAGREITLGTLLWGCELTRPVLGWAAVGSRFWLGRLAARDRLAVAIRIVIGLHMPLPGGGGAVGASG